MYETAICTLGIIIATCLISWRGFRDRHFEAKYVFHPKNILADKEYYRLVTSGFLHSGIGHLGFNMLSLYMFARSIESFYGALQLLAIYFGAILGGSLLSLFLHRHHDYTAYGASGGVCGVIFAHIFLLPGGSIHMFFLPIGIPSWLYAILFLGGTFYALNKRKDNIGHDAHLGGAICGLAVTTCLQPQIISESPRLFWSVAIISILMFIYLVKNPLFLAIPGSRRDSEAPFSHRYGSSQALVKRKVDALLDKISEKGLDSLTTEERAFLDGVSDNYRARAGSKKPKSELAL